MATETGTRSATEEQPAKERFSFTPFVEIGKDLKRRRPHYLSDWTDGYHRKVLSSSLFMFFTSIGPAITFAALLNLNTVDDSGKAQIGPVEVLLSTGLTGTIFAIFGGQPLCIVGVTGPVTIFTLSVFTIAEAMDVPFLPFYCWIQIWSALMHMALATVNACKLISLVSRYSCETFGMLIAVIYLYNGGRNLIRYFLNKELEPALLSLVLGLGTAWLALLLTGKAPPFKPHAPRLQPHAPLLQPRASRLRTHTSQLTPRILAATPRTPACNPTYPGCNHSCNSTHRSLHSHAPQARGRGPSSRCGSAH